MTARGRHLWLYLLALAAGTGAALAVAGAASVTAAPTASLRLVDFAVENVADPDSNSATIDAGGTVTFSYPDGGSFHNVDFQTDPTTCTQTAGQVLGAVPPLPTSPLGEGWAGVCRFDNVGTYAFVCQAHPNIVGEVIVVPAGGTTGTTGTTTTSTDTTPTDTTTTDTTTTDRTPPPPPRLNIDKRQQGTVLRGTVTTPAGPSRIAVSAFVSNRVLASAKRAKSVRVGSQTKRSTGTGRTSFAVKLNRAARRALKRRGRLAVTLKVVVTPAGGRAVTRTTAVALRAR